MKKTLFSHTTKSEFVKLGWTTPATIALSMSDDGEQFKYGICYCMRGDNYVKEDGRKLAEERMKAGFGIIPVPKTLQGLSPNAACAKMIRSISHSAIVNSTKWKTKLYKFKQRTKELERSQISQYLHSGRITTRKK